jgi:hypothetical protein
LRNPSNNLAAAMGFASAFVNFAASADKSLNPSYRLVIASVSEAIQREHANLDCFVACAPRNDEPLLVTTRSSPAMTK